jgi:hypothetical protein
VRIKPKKNKAELLSKLSPGDTFQIDDSLYLVLGMPVDEVGRGPVVDLFTGGVSYHPPDELVEVVDVEAAVI